MDQHTMQALLEAARQEAEQWLLDAGIAVECLDDPACEQLMRRMQEQTPELWAEDIGEPSAPVRLQP